MDKAVGFSYGKLLRTHRVDGAVSWWVNRSEKRIVTHLNRIALSITTRYNHTIGLKNKSRGIRRAKNALSHIGSPALIFEPDNDTDDYTAVTANINEEFARIQEEERRQAGTSKNAEKAVLISDDERSLKEVLKEVLKESDYKKVLPIAELIDTQGTVTPSEATVR